MKDIIYGFLYMILRIAIILGVVLGIIAVAFVCIAAITGVAYLVVLLIRWIFIVTGILLV